MVMIDESELEAISGGTGAAYGFKYQLQPGDCLPVIAQRYGTTVGAIVQLNALANPNSVKAGDYITIPYNERINMI